MALNPDARPPHDELRRAKARTFYVDLLSQSLRALCSASCLIEEAYSSGRSCAGGRFFRRPCQGVFLTVFPLSLADHFPCELQ